MLDILPFHKISKPRLECGISINLKPEGYVHITVRKSDGTLTYPYGDTWHKNTMLNWFRNFLRCDRTNTAGGGGCYGGATSGSPTIGAYGWSLSSYFAAASGGNTQNGGNGTATAVAQIVLGTSGDAVTGTEQGLVTFSKASTVVLSGNGVSGNPSNGDIVFITKRAFPAEGGPATYREVGLQTTLGGFSALPMPPSGQGWATGSGTATRTMSRLLLPAPLSVTTGDIIMATYAVVMPTLAVTPQTITISAQNGMNISGQLKCVGTVAQLAGGTISDTGVWTPTPSGNLSHGLLPNCNETVKLGLSTQATFPAAFAASTNISTNLVSPAWAAYTQNTYTRLTTATWGIGTPVADTAFRSISLCGSRHTIDTGGGYQLLLDADMTKAAASSLTVGFRFDT